MQSLSDIRTYSNKRFCIRNKVYNPFIHSNMQDAQPNETLIIIHNSNEEDLEKF